MERRQSNRSVQHRRLRAAYARRNHWFERLSTARLAGDDVAAEEAKRFIAEYEELIAELECQQPRE